MLDLARSRRDDLGMAAVVLGAAALLLWVLGLSASLDPFDVIYAVGGHFGDLTLGDVVAASSILLAVLTMIRGRRLRQEVAERRRAEQEAQEANERLTKWVQDLETRNREIALLNEASELMQSCLSPEELSGVTAQAVQQLFPSSSGALFVLSQSRDLVEAEATWGEVKPEERAFGPEDCWALRRGKLHRMDESSSTLACRHLVPPVPDLRVCVPLVAQGDTVGVLHLRFNGEDARSTIDGPKEQLAVAVAGQIAQSLASLRLRRTLRDQAIRDSLTGLFNRRYMEETLEREVHRSSRRSNSLSVMMLDADHFKQFNDLYGHEAGDLLLRALGSHLKSSLRGEDIACRYGGEEFALILPDTPLKVALKRAEELREGVASLVVQHRRQSLGKMTISIGVASAPEHGRNGEAVLRAADAALYRAKAEGRNRVCSAAVEAAAVTSS